MTPTAKPDDCGRLDEYLAHGLSGDELLCFEAHLKGCLACREEVAAQRAIEGLLREGTSVAAGAVPVELAGRIETVWQQRRQRRHIALGTLAAIAAAALIAVSLWAIGSGGPDAANGPVADGTNTRPQPPGEREKVAPAPEEPNHEDVAQAPAAERVRVTFADPERQIIVPVESPSANVTILWLYPTMQTGQTARAENSGDSSSITHSSGSKT